MISKVVSNTGGINVAIRMKTTITIASIANAAHVGGLIAGLLAGALSAAWRHK